MAFGEETKFGTPIGPTIVWDFTKSIPEGGFIRPGGDLIDGLVSKTFDISVAGGFQLKKREFKLPEAFRFEAKITPDLELRNTEKTSSVKKEKPEDIAKGSPKKSGGIIWDTMYVTYKKEPASQYNRGFQLQLKNAGKNRWRPQLFLGDGKTTSSVFGPVALVEPGASVVLKFFYNANGSIYWEFAGEKRVSRTGCSGKLADGRFAPVIGDRYGSNYDIFPGRIERVALTPCRRDPLGLLTDGRKVYYRGEKDAKISFRLIRGTKVDFESLKLTAVLRNGPDESKIEEPQKINDQTNESKVDRSVITRTEYEASSLLKEGAIFSVPIETRLKTGRYLLDIILSAKQKDGSDVFVQHQEEIGIGPIFTERFPALMWNFNGRPFEELRTFGFTHGIDSFLLHGPECEYGTEQQINDRFDRAILNGLQLVSHISACPPEKKEGGYYRVSRDGKTILSNRKPMLEVLNPEVIEHTRKTAAFNAKLFGKHPGFAGILINTERRDGVVPSFGFAPDLYRTETGQNIPANVTGSMPSPKMEKQHYQNGLIPENDELLRFYSWFWQGGDGWPRINTVIADEFRSIVKPHFFSFFDPAVRVPPKWGSGGKVDVLSQWIYAVPEPLSVAGPIEELFAMAAGNRQDVMIMTQIICYRNQIAPKKVQVQPMPAWVVEKPDADFPTIPPDSIQEATWAMIAKPVKGIMYHGYGCIVELGAKTGYTYTNSETPKRLTWLLNEIVAPLGPVLNKLPREDSPVVLLESFSNALFSGYATWGWKAPDLLFLQRARLDPRVVYDETILRDGFGNAKVLYMPQCAFLSEKVCEKVMEFQKKGGIIIGDDKLLSVIQPNIKWSIQDRENALKRNRLDTTEETSAEHNNVLMQKKKMNAEAMALREKLAPFYSPKADSSSPELITFSRRWKDVDYLFVINDHRTYGDYVGQWKMTMEKGLPYDGSITLDDPGKKIGAVYELSQGRKINFTRTDQNAVKVDLSFKTNDGRMLVFLPKPIHSVSLDLAHAVTKGQKIRICFRVKDSEGQPIHALLPVEIHLYDASGREMDGAGYACAQDGVCELDVLTNINDPQGKYRITAKDRASGLVLEKTVLAK